MGGRGLSNHTSEVILLKMTKRGSASLFLHVLWRYVQISLALKTFFGPNVKTSNSLDLFSPAN